MQNYEEEVRSTKPRKVLKEILIDFGLLPN